MPEYQELPDHTTLLKNQLRLHFREDTVGEYAIHKSINDKLNNLVKTLTINTGFKQDTRIGLYYPMKQEVDIEWILEHYLNQYNVIYLPKITKGDMNFHPIYKDNNITMIDQLKHSSRFKQLMEPRNALIAIPSIVISCGLAFDRKGIRLGYGKGFYDKFFTKNNPIKIGLCFASRLLNNIPYTHRDIPMDYIITEEETITCHKR